MRIIISFIVLAFCLSLYSATGFAQGKSQPNVIIIITDDQGYGDFGITGNPHVKTPVIDRFATESIRFNNFYVSPVCAPTRSSLMTGRYSLRTGVRDTYNGGAIMASSEVTIAELLKRANYKTGIFGKWHLGDNYPSRPSDQGFDESLIHLSGGMGQVGDITTYFKRDSSYFDPVLWHNNKREAYQGYCSDIFTDQAINFISKNSESPFFCYLSFNAPHTPLQVPEKYYSQYKDIDPASGFKDDKRPFLKMTEKDKEDARKVYAMVTNIDDNIGKLLKRLDELKITENTLIIFMTDNGPQQTRYVAGMRGLKGNVYQGGVRVPFYVRYPSSFGKNKDIETMAAHLDILPTVAELCHVDLPNDRIIDGKSLIPLIKGKQVDWANRSLFTYWTRRYPELYSKMSVHKGNYKLVGNTDYNAKIEDFELYDLNKDSYEQNNIVLKNKALANTLKQELDRTFNDLISSENLINQPPIIVGSKFENPIILNRNDAGGERGIWDQEEVNGNWKVKIQKGHYNIKFKFLKPLKANGRMYLEASTIVRQIQNKTEGKDIIEMKNVYFPDMDCELRPYYSFDSKNIFPFWVEMERID
ncbi:MAG: arylsulfatase [Sphingobacteriales bacterium 17-39-43]|uniref:arylsulfatase n=1 Tax=Daejeonella sp. TaxID=2805397 RepID=UPI000BC7B1DF|nr:arylsulfatase [Daejeonella sp.]OYY04552.1 MAG: arylsulfatase [Sphingobacteriia bacterium 35-40-5]OYZ31558.1 MAG: arylsulfatase [Sphingobacteriales bacterium 16-39-50]OZA24749.1 MAG: arylsulfatase [Sphingobacteriales bacterium 17-39-43]HQT22707.1 arylsulfatase [Daejeonella sp.]HQT57602.1 arylsulfatase [Daejeonella sp.]